MKNPLDTVMRLQRRELDDVRRSIHAERTEIDRVEAEVIRLRNHIARETNLAAEDWSLPVHGFRRAALAKRRHLDAERDARTVQLGRLQDDARDAFASLRATEQAAERHREDARIEEQRAAQNAADDFVLAGYARGLARGGRGGKA